MISIIVPVYNAENRIDRCVKSVLLQTYKDLELILVDDGSVDSSLQKCIEWEKKDPRVKVIHQENMGGAAARNTGLDNATGDWISFIDSDDYVDDTLYEKLVSAANTNNSDIVLCDFRGEWENDPIPYTENQDPHNIEYNTIEFLKLLYTSGEHNFFPVLVWGKIYKKEIWNGNTPLRFNGDYRVSQDEEVLNRLYVKDYNIFFLDDNLYHYVQHDDGSLQNSSYNVYKWKSMEIFYQRIFIFEKIDDYLYRQSVLRYLNLYIVNYYKAIKLKDFDKTLLHKDCYDQIFSIYRQLFGWNKTTLRFSIFKTSPSLYKQIVSILH